jgi:chromosome segregation ATPase
MIQPSDLVRLRHLHQVVARAEAALARAEAALAREKAALEHAKVETEHLKQENAERKVALKQQLARMEQYNECRKLYEKKIAFIARTAGEGAVSLQKFHKSLEEHRKLREQRLDTLRGVLAKFSGQVPTGREA